MDPIVTKGRNGVITVYGEPTRMAPVIPDPPERDFAAEQKADQAPLSKLQKLIGLSREDIDFAIGAYGFPKPIGRKVHIYGFGEPYYLLTQYREWRERFDAFAAKLR